MPGTDNAPTSDDLICKDKMKLTVTNIYPASQKRPQQAARQEIGVQLYRIFKKYADV